MATIQLLGRIAKEVREFDNGKKISFTIADNSAESTQYFEVVYNNFEKLTPHLTVGKELMVSGTLIVKKNETEKGIFTNLTIYANNIQLTSGNSPKEDK